MPNFIIVGYVWQILGKIPPPPPLFREQPQKAYPKKGLDASPSTGSGITFCILLHSKWIQIFMLIASEDYLKWNNYCDVKNYMFYIDFSSILDSSDLFREDQLSRIN